MLPACMSSPLCTRSRMHLQRAWLVCSAHDGITGMTIKGGPTGRHGQLHSHGGCTPACCAFCTQPCSWDFMVTQTLNRLERARIMPKSDQKGGTRTAGRALHASVLVESLGWSPGAVQGVGLIATKKAHLETLTPATCMYTSCCEGGVRCRGMLHTHAFMCAAYGF